MASQITAGLFRTDANKATWGRVWQFLSRFTWELPQTLSGWLFTSVRALAGQVDRVDVLGGITFATKTGYAYDMGVSLGTFVDLWMGNTICGEDESFVCGDPLCMHEFGHTADSRRFGWLYLPVIGLPSLLSANGHGDHNRFWTEIRANSHAKRYFSRYYQIAWNDQSYPTKNYS